ncbi:MAG: pyridoxamine 5'-phosphate oxidase family protein [Clostridia bacterium]|nr:pyridoxamine 5'-phosphate oxidase family protein [Clostridia bacterium]
MKRKKKNTEALTPMEQVDALLTKVHVFYVATVEDDQPRVRPFGAHLYKDGTIWFITGKGKDVSRQLHKNPKLELCGYADGTWLRLTGEAVFVDDPDLGREMLAHAPNMARKFYKSPLFVQKAILRKMPGLNNMVRAGVPYEEGMEPFYVKNMKVTEYHLREKNQTFDL